MRVQFTPIGILWGLMIVQPTNVRADALAIH